MSTCDPVFLNHRSNALGLLIRVLCSYWSEPIGGVQNIGNTDGGGTDDFARHGRTLLVRYNNRATGPWIHFLAAQLLVGINASYVLPETPSGPAIVLVAGAIFILSALIGPLGLRGQFNGTKKLSRTTHDALTKIQNLFAIVIFTSIANASFAEDRLKIVASFSILGDMVEQVVGEHADVTTIVGPDADAHVYQPSVADARAVADADIIFVNGLGFETWSDTLISESGTNASVTWPPKVLRL